MRSPLLTLCLVSDRRRLLARCGKVADWQEALRAQLAAAIASGVDVVQLREPDLPARELLDLTRWCLARCRETDARVVINDRLDVAIAAGAHGVHLGGRSLAITAARRLWLRPRLIGCAVHSAVAALAKSDADYLLAGTVLPSHSKPQGGPLLGLNGLREVVVAAQGAPVWAIGGISAQRVAAVVRCGVAGIAAIEAFLPAAGADISGSVSERTRVLRAALADQQGQDGG